MTVSMCVGILYQNLKKSITNLSVGLGIFFKEMMTQNTRQRLFLKKTRLRYWSGHHKAQTCFPMNNLWSVLHQELHFEERSSKNKFFERIKEEWRSINQEAAKKLVDNLNQRLKAVIVAKEGPDKH
ncbi:hypothetical protein AVEN_256440-1 [Araneus ventricosus]|uniref:Uncharacterized protein n=1 Tax=Araneus ventricosus TaxID=182803 RepID=A0A4Y2LNV1_ARAVE|nr:hypothetical protein AVEN_256440-1 [Araneus ventricosus]